MCVFAQRVATNFFAINPVIAKVDWRIASSSSISMSVSVSLKHFGIWPNVSRIPLCLWRDPTVQRFPILVQFVDGYVPLFSVCFNWVPDKRQPSYTPLWAAMGKFMMLNAFNSPFWANPLVVLAFATCWQWVSIPSDRPLTWNRTCELEWFAKAAGKEQRNLSMLFWGCSMTEWLKPSLTGAKNF